MLPYSTAPGKASVASKEQPLAGRRVAVTRPKEQRDDLAALLGLLGAEVLFFPAIEILPPGDWAPADAALQSLDKYDWVVFTSRNAVEQCHSRLAQLKLDVSIFSRARIAAIGIATSDALEIAGIHVNVVPARALAAEIPGALGAIDGLRILLPRSDIARPELPAALRALGANVEEVPVYCTVGGDGAVALAERVRSGGLDAITFASASAVRSIAHAAAAIGSREWTRDPDRPRVVVIGPVTAAAAKDLNLPVDTVAATHDAHGLALAVIDALSPTLSAINCDV